MHEYLIAKIAGSSAGALLAIVLILPRTLGEAVRRWAAGVAAGVLGAGRVCEYAGWALNFENITLSAATLAFCAWWIGGLIARALDNFSKSPVAERAIDNVFIQWLKQK